MKTRQRRTDDGFSLVEMLVVMTVLGILAAAVVMVVTGYRDDAEDSACPADWRNLNTSVESYFAQYDTTTIAQADATPDGYERTLTNAGIMREVSEFYDLDATGGIAPSLGSPCT